MCSSPFDAIFHLIILNTVSILRDNDNNGDDEEVEEEDNKTARSIADFLAELPHINIKLINSKPTQYLSVCKHLQPKVSTGGLVLNIQLG